MYPASERGERDGRRRGDRAGSVAGWSCCWALAQQDGEAEVEWLAEKIVGLRIFEDDEGKMNRSLAEVGGAMLVVSQFTLYGDCRKGRRPSFTDAAPPELAERLYDAFVARVREAGRRSGDAACSASTCRCRW